MAAEAGKSMKAAASKKIYVHGWATDGRAWQGVAGQGADAVSIDLPGHGSMMEWDEPTLTPGVRCILPHIPLGRQCIGVGWSLGGGVLIDAAGRFKDRFRALVLIGATPSFVRREGFPWGQKKAAVRKMLMDMKKAPERTLKRFYGLNFTEEELATDNAARFLGLYAAIAPSFDLNGISTALSALMEFDLRDSLASIDVPVLILHGRLDAVVPVGAGRCMAGRMKNARLVEFERAGHAPFITEPERFKRVVAEFLEDL